LLENDIVVYISAASDLKRERDILGRIAAEIPVDTGWRIVLSPTGDGVLDRESIQFADIHFLLLGGDIRSPIGQEWILAKQAGRQPIPYLKTGILRTSAAVDFSRYIKAQAIWKPFSNGVELRRYALLDIIDHMLANALRYSLTLSNIEQLQLLGEKIKSDTGTDEYVSQSATGSSSVILSPEAIASKGGVLIEKKN
jgi:hypothetical protein